MKKIINSTGGIPWDTKSPLKFQKTLQQQTSLKASTKLKVFKEKELINIYVLSALFSGGRLFVGAISFLYLLSKGIATEQIAIVKSIQIATFLIFDIPFGIFIKKVGYKFSLLVTFSVSIIGMVLYACGNSISFFILAEFFLALSLCLSPTTFADYIMYFLKNNSGLSVERVFHRNEVYTNIANLLCGSIGGILFTLSSVIPFIAAIFFQLLGFYLTFQIPSP